MTDPSDRSLRHDWRERIAEIGKRNFELEEMLRLGFIAPEDLTQGKDTAQTLVAYRQTLEELAAIRRELVQLDVDISSIGSVDELIKKIRARRIETVKAERARRKAEKEAESEARRRRNEARRLNEPTFLGHRVSDRLQFEGGDPERIIQGGLPVLSTFTDIAEAVELTPSELQWLTYERGADSTDHYTRFEIPKRTGGRRLISTPKPAMRAAQQWVRSNVLAPLPLSPSAAAFRQGRSIVDNAKRHSGKSCVIRMDLKDFFPSITFPRVRGFFESLGYNPGVATVLALLCTDAPRARVTLDGKTQHVVIGHRALPQGACTSPDLSNVIAGKLDARLAGLARSFGYDYTRYADDLVFSTDVEDTAATIVVSAARRICTAEGFVVNSLKTRTMRAPNRQVVTGLLVNSSVRLTRRDLRRIRAFLHRCETHGIEAVSAEIGKDAAAVAKGYFAYIFMVTPSVALKLAERHPWI